MGLALSARQLSKSFAGTRAVSNLDLEVKQGETFGLIGPDGAGKTTILRLLSTAMEQTSGEASVLGLDVRTREEEIRTRIGYMPQAFSLYRDMTVAENIDFFADLYGIAEQARQKKKQELLSFTGLAPFTARKAENLSGGMQKKLALSCSLIHAPELLFLDEPTTGVDPISRREFWKILAGLPDMTVCVATPYLDEAERCDRVALVREGRLLICDTPQNIKQKTGTRTLEQSFVHLIEGK